MIHIFLFILSYDVWFYLSHLILHNKTVYKIIHKYHHSIDHNIIKYKDTYVGHFVESPLQGMGVAIPLLFIKFNLHIFLCSLLIINIRGMLRHDVRSIWLIGNHHILHHKYPQCNYGEYWLDTLFGTCCPNRNEYVFGMVYM